MNQPSSKVPSVHRIRALAPALILAVAAFGSAAALGETHRVKMVDPPPYFQPSELVINVGDTVIWENNGPEGIHIVSETGQTIYSGDVPVETTWSHQFLTAGEYDIICGRHFFMRSRITVRNADGSVEKRFKHPYQAAFNEFAIPTREGIPRMIIRDKFNDSMWFTIGGGDFYGFEGIPPQNKLAEVTKDGQFVEFATATDQGKDGASVGVDSLVQDRHGNIWFSERISNQIGKLTPEGEIFEFPLELKTGYALGVDMDKAGNVWFAQRYGNRIGWITPQGEITEIELPEPDSEPRTIFVAQDGMIWYTARVANEIGRYDPTTGEFHTLEIPTKIARPAGIAETSDGTIYFVQMVGNKISRVDGNRIVEFALPSAFAAPFKIVPDKNDNLWFTEVFGNSIGFFNTRTQEIYEFEIPTIDSRPGGIAIDWEGDVWFTQQKGNKVAYIDVDQLQELLGEGGPDLGGGALVADAQAANSPASTPASALALSPRSTAPETVAGSAPSADTAFDEVVSTLSLEDYPLPTPGGFPANALVPDEQGRIWFPEMFGNAIAYYDPQAGEFFEVPLPRPMSMPTSVAMDDKGGVWFTQFRGNRLGRLDTQALALDEYELPRKGALPASAAVDAQGNVWFVEMATGRLVSFDTESHAFSDYPLPVPDSSPLSLTIDAQQIVWVTNDAADPPHLARFDPSLETFTVERLPAGMESAVGITARQDLWVTSSNGKVGHRVAADGTWRIYDVPAEKSSPFQLALAADGVVWVTDGGGFGSDGANQIIAIDPVSGQLVQMPLQAPRAKPAGILALPNGDVWFTKKGSNSLGRVTGASRTLAFDQSFDRSMQK